MKVSDPLFSLIKSLSKSEKRYFRLQARHTGFDQNYWLLFETMDKMVHFDEALIRKKFQHHRFSRQMHVTKNYLRKLILKSLRNFYSEDSSEIKLHGYLQDIEILFKKDLYELCLKSIRSAEKLARKFDNQLALLEILGWKRRVQLLRKGAARSQMEINEIIEEERAALRSLKHLCEYWSLTINLANRFGNKDFHEILENPYLADERHASNYRSRILYYHLLYTTHTILDETDKSEQALDHLIQFLESEIDQLKEDPGAYVTAINNKIGLYLNQKRLSEIPPLLQLIRDIPLKYSLKDKGRTTMKLWLRSYNVELETYRDSHHYQQGVVLIPKVRKFLDQYHDHIPLEYHVLFRYQFAYLYFMEGSFSAALADINPILVQRYSGIRDDIMGYAHFLNLIIHYELGNITVLRYAVESTRRFLKKRGKLLEFEKVLLGFFSKLSTKPHSLHKSLFKTLKQKLFGEPLLINDSQLDYLNFRHWIAEKLN